jgi:phosphoribulokinase
MSVKHPIVAITGSSGAGTSTVTKSFDLVFRREKLKAAIVEGDSFHRYDRKSMKVAMEEARLAGNNHFSHFGPEANLLEELGDLFKTYGKTGKGKVRKYLHNAEEAAPYGQQSGEFTPWEDIPEGTDLMFYEGLHGAP